MSPSQPHSCDSVISIADEPKHHLEIDNEWVRAYAVEIAPGEITLCHLHPWPYLMYVAGEANIISTPRGGKAENQRFAADYCDLHPAGLEHVVENVNSATFRAMIFEVLPATQKLRHPKPSSGQAAGVRMTTLYSGDVICAQLIELQAGSQAQIAGASVLATPYEDTVEFISPEHGTRKLQHYRQLEYLPSGSNGLLRCESGGPARVLVVALGSE
ncbi:MAG: hypothetical protein WAM71_08100 [Candidatus Korobacteraceae bacterium]